MRQDAFLVAFAQNLYVHIPLSSTDLVMHWVRLGFSQRNSDEEKSFTAVWGHSPLQNIRRYKTFLFSIKYACDSTHASGWPVGVCQTERCRESRKCCKRRRDVYHLKCDINGLSSKIQYSPFLNESRELFQHFTLTEVVDLTSDLSHVKVGFVTQSLCIHDV